MTLSHDEYIKRATAGYRFLASPEGRRLGFEVELLNPDTLKLSDACCCALGETYAMGNYWDAAERLADEGYPIVTLDDETAVDAEAEERCPTYLWERMHGFMLAGPDGQDLRDYAQLTDAWREVIKRERDGG